MAFIEIKHLTHVFKSNDEKKDGLKALDDINLNIDKGEFIAVIGVNGSGKSTLAKHLNGLLLPTEGACFVDGIKVEDSEEIWKVRQKVSMVFQNPDNQIIATIVEDDIAFGPENMGLPREEIRKRVEFALQSLHIEHLRKFAPHLLSGGQKQLTAIAGAIAMRTNCLILDEPTAMLDPQGRIAVMNALKELHEKYNMTIIMITHFMEEAMQAQRIVVMDNNNPLIRSDMDISLYSEIFCPVSCSYKGGIGVFLFKSAQATMGNHLYLTAVQLYGIHFNYLLLVISLVSIPYEFI